MKIKAVFLGLAVVFVAALSKPHPAYAQNNLCEGQKIAVFGDSLVAGYGLNPGEGFPEQLQKAIDAKGYKINFANAGVSGDTSSGGLARLDWSLDGETKAVILELGANDALRGIAPEVTRKNLEDIIEKLKTREIDIVIAGMMAPPNMGATYANKFNAIYPDLAAKHDIILYPFFLEGVVADPKLNQADGIHPTKQGIAVMVENFLPTSIKLIEKVCG